MINLSNISLNYTAIVSSDKINACGNIPQECVNFAFNYVKNDFRTKTYFFLVISIVFVVVNFFNMYSLYTSHMGKLSKDYVLLSGLFYSICSFYLLFWAIVLLTKF